ncbi:DUF3987 domain-containing protein [Ferrimicrobium sp.]|uniref:DUF3987 domain-containing protein n=1 Tax=Ferrimicrobium sp. TaxID=2926050 RepID=UPI002638DFF4|nr:DUF3987 domain-containing protein [Ferrimicrobium sp.]
MRPLDRVLDALTARGSKIEHHNGSYTAQCPAHPDGRPSLAISEGADGRVLLHCFAGCTTASILSALELEAADLFPEQDKPTARQIVATYPYRRADGSLAYEVMRYHPKDFKQRMPDGRGGWVWNLKALTPEDRELPFRLPELLDAIKGNPGAPLVIVEGEKDALALWSQGTPATCNAAGAGKWRSGHSRAIIEAGFKDILIWGDRDDPGRKHAVSVFESLRREGYAGTFGVFEPACSDGCKDASDLIAHHGDDWPEQPTRTFLDDDRELLPWAREYGTESIAFIASIASKPLPGETGAESIAFTIASTAKSDAEPSLEPILSRVGMLGKYASALAKEHQVDLSFAFATAFGVAGIPVGLGATVEITEGWKEAGILHVVIVAPPAERKTPVLVAAMKALWSAESEARAARDAEIIEAKAQEVMLTVERDAAKKEGSQSLKSAITKLEAHQIPNRFTAIASKATGEALEALAAAQGENIARVAVVSDEGGGVFGDLARYSKSGANYEILLAGYDAAHFSSHRLSRADVRVDELRVPLMLMAQPSAWGALTSDSDAAGRGLLARISPVRPESLVGTRFGFGPPIAEVVAKEWAATLEHLFSEAYVSDQPRMTLSAGAFHLFEQVKDEIEAQMLTTYQGDLLSGWAGKLAGRMVRIAAVLHAVNRGSLTGAITEEEMTAAVEIGKWLAWHARREYGGENIAPVLTKDAARLLDWAGRNGGEFTSTEALHGLYGWRRNRFDKAAAELMNLGLLEQLDARGIRWRVVRGGMERPKSDASDEKAMQKAMPNQPITAGESVVSDESDESDALALETENETEEQEDEVIMTANEDNEGEERMTEPRRLIKKNDPPRFCAECGRPLSRSTGDLCKSCEIRRQSHAS